MEIFSEARPAKKEIHMPEPGSAAPDFSLPDAQGRPRRLSEFRGKRIVLSFYPMDGTPGCAQAAYGFRDHFATYTEEGIEIIGVSLAPPESHEDFAAEHNLPFLLLSDVDAEASKAYGVYESQKTRGKKTAGIVRTTFVIAPDGLTERVYRDIQAETHALDVLRGLGDSGRTEGEKELPPGVKTTGGLLARRPPDPP